MIVVTEGIDRVGKTTFCNKLHELTDWPIYKHDNKQFQYEDMNPMDETDKMLQMIDLLDAVDDQLTSLSKGIIFDRFHFSDYAYGCQYRHGYDFIHDAQNVFTIEDRLKKAKQEACLVLLYDEYGTKRASIEHGEDLSWIDGVMKRLYDASSLRKIKGTYHDVPEMAMAVAKAASNLEHSKE